MKQRSMAKEKKQGAESNLGEEPAPLGLSTGSSDNACMPRAIALPRLDGL